MRPRSSAGRASAAANSAPASTSPRAWTQHAAASTPASAQARRRVTPRAEEKDRPCREQEKDPVLPGLAGRAQEQGMQGEQAGGQPRPGSLVTQRRHQETDAGRHRDH
jgi:hypothetical protein